MVTTIFFIHNMKRANLNDVKQLKTVESKVKHQTRQTNDDE